MATATSYQHVPAINFYPSPTMEPVWADYVNVPDFNQAASPVAPSGSPTDINTTPTTTSFPGRVCPPDPTTRAPFPSVPTTSTPALPVHDDSQAPVKPSHQYELFKQQAGLPRESVGALSLFPTPSSFYNLDAYPMEETPMENAYPVSSWGGVDINSITRNGYCYDDMPQHSCVDPSNLAQQEATPVRVYPGHHQQQAQAAAAKAEQERLLAVEQQQQQQQQLVRQQRQQQHAHFPHNQQQQRLRQRQQETLSSPSAHYSQRQSRSQSLQNPEEHRVQTIARVLNQLRQGSQASVPESQSDQDHSHPLLRAKKDEDEMDEDERLLASEEGKKLTSKERRQLRNKVSARNFRSRRKDYIQELEKGLAAKTQETHHLAIQNRKLHAENQCYREFIQNTLHDQTFVPLLERLSREQDPVTVTMKMPPPAMAPTPSLASATSQLQITPFGEMNAFGTGACGAANTLVDAKMDNYQNLDAKMVNYQNLDAKMDNYQNLNSNVTYSDWGSMNPNNFQSSVAHGMEGVPVKGNAGENGYNCNDFVS